MHHILLIEDDEAIAVSLRHGLEREGYSVTWCDTGEAGIDHLKLHQTHLTILDVRLPGMSGFEVCQQMRHLQFHQPIIMLTVRNEEVDKILGLELGADDYLTKPFAFRELLSRIKAQMRRAYGEFSTIETNQLHIADLVIDRNRGQVLRGEIDINLTPTEFRLFVFLAQHSGQIISREQIMTTLWGHDLTPESERSINTHIRRLREKIEIDPGDPQIILTVLGAGYRLIA